MKDAFEKMKTVDYSPSTSPANDSLLSLHEPVVVIPESEGKEKQAPPPIPPPRRGSAREAAAAMMDSQLSSSQDSLPLDKLLAEEGFVVMELLEPDSDLSSSDKSVGSPKSSLLVGSSSSIDLDPVEEKAKWLNAPGAFSIIEDYIKIPDASDFEISSAPPDDYPPPKLTIIVKNCSFCWTMYGGCDWGRAPVSTNKEIMISCSPQRMVRLQPEYN